MKNKEAIILAGGKGTRLSKVVSGVPKPMAIVAGRPFLCHLLDVLKKNHFTRIIIADGYLRNQIETYFGNSYLGMEIRYSSESTPLGTGGAVRRAIELCKTPWVYVFNGDTYFDANFEEVDVKLLNVPLLVEVVLCATQVENSDRYGTICYSEKDGTVLSFSEKEKSGEGVISAGVYVLNKQSFMKFPIRNFSIEKEYFEKIAGSGKMVASILQGTFIDIGTPKDFDYAQVLLGMYFRK